MQDIPRSYDNFDIHIGSPQDGRYPLTVIYSPAGETIKAEWQTLPQDEISNKYVYYLREQIGFPNHAEELGQLLHDFLFPPPIQKLFDRSLAMLRYNQVGLRVRLRLEADQLKLSRIPWEYCWGDKTFLALTPDTPLVRYLPTDVPHQPLTRPLPLHVLLVTADPIGNLDLSAERHHIQEALHSLDQEKGQVVLHLLENATRQTLGEAVQQVTPHILHFIGHGNLTPQGDGVLLHIPVKTITGSGRCRSPEPEQSDRFQGDNAG